MKYLIFFLIYVYMATGFLIGLRLPFKYKIGKILAGCLYTFIWVPDLIAGLANKTLSKK